MTKTFARSGVAIVAFAGLLVAAPAMAFTHHPSTPAEREQTKELNLQALSSAQSQAPANQMANANANTSVAPSDMSGAPQPQTPATTAPSDQQATPSAQQPAQPAQPSDSNNTQQAPAPQ